MARERGKPRTPQANQATAAWPEQARPAGRPDGGDSCPKKGAGPTHNLRRIAGRTECEPPRITGASIWLETSREEALPPQP